ncbi:hypothetical protein PV797_00690 [Clostridiaceae bacterium M8S5]|nr:hypothetical protein PV797_00690 [Clostridiaceae bacterium M8S5]
MFKERLYENIVYHIAPIHDLDKILTKGIVFDDKITYEVKYKKFHEFIDNCKTDDVPEWVIRKKAIFASLELSNHSGWHSHSVILALKVDPKKCWIANENIANECYEPFILKNVKDFSKSENYIIETCKRKAKSYWSTSCSYEQNLSERHDMKCGYDCEVMVFHEIKPENIIPLAIVSDHKIMSIDQWKELLYV